MKETRTLEMVKVFLLGVLATIMLFILVGAGSDSSDAKIGKYELAIGDKYCYIIETSSGRVKIVNVNGTMNKRKHQINTSFDDMAPFPSTKNVEIYNLTQAK